jgi:hypothetical protein
MDINGDGRVCASDLTAFVRALQNNTGEHDSNTACESVGTNSCSHIDPPFIQPTLDESMLMFHSFSDAELTQKLNQKH